jgi:hypothetical protein
MGSPTGRWRIHGGKILEIKATSKYFEDQMNVESDQPAQLPHALQPLVHCLPSQPHLQLLLHVTSLNYLDLESQEQSIWGLKILNPSVIAMIPYAYHRFLDQLILACISVEKLPANIWNLWKQILVSCFFFKIFWQFWLCFNYARI